MSDNILVTHVSSNCTFTVDMEKRSKYLSDMCKRFDTMGDPAWAFYLRSQDEITDEQCYKMVNDARTRRKLLKSKRR